MGAQKRSERQREREREWEWGSDGDRMWNFNIGNSRFGVLYTFRCLSKILRHIIRIRYRGSSNIYLNLTRIAFIVTANRYWLVWISFRIHAKCARGWFWAVHCSQIEYSVRVCFCGLSWFDSIPWHASTWVTRPTAIFLSHGKREYTSIEWFDRHETDSAGDAAK